MPKGGRPRALDDVKRREICALVTAGYGIQGAAKYVGCAASTVRRESLRNPEFYERLRKAQLAAELDPLRAIRNDARTHWRAAAWLLERLNPERYGKRNPVHLKPEQVDELFEQFTELIVNAVKDQAAREEVQQALSEFSLKEASNARADRQPLRDAHRAQRMLNPASREEDIA